MTTTCEVTKRCAVLLLKINVGGREFQITTNHEVKQIIIAGEKCVINVFDWDPKIQEYDFVPHRDSYPKTNHIMLCVDQKQLQTLVGEQWNDMMANIRKLRKLLVEHFAIIEDVHPYEKELNTIIVVHGMILDDYKGKDNIFRELVNKVDCVPRNGVFFCTKDIETQIYELFEFPYLQDALPSDEELALRMRYPTWRESTSSNTQKAKPWI